MIISIQEVYDAREKKVENMRREFGAAMQDLCGGRGVDAFPEIDPDAKPGKVMDLAVESRKRTLNRDLAGELARMDKAMGLFRKLAEMEGKTEDPLYRLMEECG